MNIVFMGTPDFAVPCLNKLIEAGHHICCVFTQPDKPVGRKQILTPPPVKELAEKFDIPVYQPEKIKGSNALEIIKSYNPDVNIVVAYGKILPKEILNSAKYGSINVHASLLPKYRGAAPIQWAVLNGDKKTGVSIMQMDEGLDTGDILYVEETPIGENETSAELFDRLSIIGADALIKTLTLLENDELAPKKQPEGDGFYACMIDKSMCDIDWSDSAEHIHNKVRGLQTWPVASTTINNKKLKIHKTVISGKTSDKAGMVVDNKGVLSVCCGDGKCLDILELQLDGNKRMAATLLFQAHQIEIGSVLGAA